MTYTIKEIERACRLFLQDMWDDQSEVQVLSPDGKEIILGGILGIEISKQWLKIKKYLNQLGKVTKTPELTSPGDLKPNSNKNKGWEYTCRYCNKSRPKPGEVWGINPGAVCSCDYYSMLSLQHQEIVEEERELLLEEIKMAGKILGYEKEVNEAVAMVVTENESSPDKKGER